MLTFGLLLWIGYGFLRGDVAVICANIIGVALSGLVLFCKLRDLQSKT